MPEFLRALFSNLNISAKLGASGGIAKDYLSGLGNIPVFKYNILLIASVTQVLSRIAVAYHTKQKAKGTPDEEYRNVEFIRTAFRESVGVSLSYGLVKVLERALTSGFKIRLLKKGVPLEKANINIQETPLFDKLFAWAFRFDPQKIPKGNRYPGFFESLKKLGGAWFGKEGCEALTPDHHFNLAFPEPQELNASAGMSDLVGERLPKLLKTPLNFLKGLSSGQMAEDLGQKFSNWSPKWLTNCAKWPLERFKGFLPEINNVELLQNFFKFGPVLIASIPAVILSGYVLEHFNQKHSDQLAKYIADHLGHHKKKTAALPAVETPQPVPALPLDPQPAVPYAYNQPMPMTAPTGVGFYGAAYPPVQPNQNPWTWGYSQMSGYGYRPYSPY